MGGRLYFHWGQDWSVNLELEEVTLRRSIKEQQKIIVSTQQVTLTGDFEVTAVERELFAMTFVLRGMADQWQIRDVLIDRQQTGFEYRTEDEGDRQLLKIELKKPVQPEKMTNVTIVLQNIPPKLGLAEQCELKANFSAFNRITGRNSLRQCLCFRPG